MQVIKQWLVELLIGSTDDATNVPILAINVYLPLVAVQQTCIETFFVIMQKIQIK